MSRSPHPWGLDTALPACRCCYSLKTFFCRQDVVFLGDVTYIMPLSVHRACLFHCLGGEIVTRSFHLRAR